MTERERFEEWWEVRENRVHSKEIAWEGWKAARRWILVSERLPKNGQFVLGYSHLWSDPLSVYQCGGTFYLGGELASQPTHWQPLPAPPEVEE